MGSVLSWKLRGGNVSLSWLVCYLSAGNFSTKMDYGQVWFAANVRGHKFSFIPCPYLRSFAIMRDCFEGRHTAPTPWNNVMPNYSRPLTYSLLFPVVLPGFAFSPVLKAEALVLLSRCPPLLLCGVERGVAAPVVRPAGDHFTSVAADATERHLLLWLRTEGKALLLWLQWSFELDT